MLEITKRLFSELNKNGVQYCNWKGTSKIDEGLEGKSDVDLIVAKDSQKAAETTLRENGFVLVKTQWAYRFPDVYDWLGIDEQTGRLIHIHLHYRLIAGHPYVMEYILPWIEEVLKSRKKLDNGVYTISPNWEMIVFLSRLGLEYPNKKVDVNKGTLKEVAQQEFLYLQEHLEWEGFDNITTCILKEGADEIKQIARKERLSIEDFRQLQRVWLRLFKGNGCCMYNKVKSQLRSYAAKTVCPLLHEIVWIPGKKTIETGISIAFLGQDGAGKSTVTREINKWLGWKLEAKVFYLGSGDEFYNPWQKKILKRIKGKDSSMAKIIRGWLSFSYLLASAKYVKKTIERANRYVEKGGIALFDRYPQMEYKGINDGPKIREMLLPHVPNKLRWLAQKYANKEEKILSQAVKSSPTMAFKLILSPEESKRRRPHDNIEIIKKKHSIVKNFAFPSSDVKIINAEQPYDQELIQIKNEIWKKIQSL